MVEDWWKAHELEYVVGGIAILAVLVAMGIYLVVLAVRERRARSRRMDDALAAEVRRQVAKSGGRSVIVIEERE